MRYRLDLTLRRAEGALARVLGTAERRGFQPLSVDGDAHDDGDHHNESDQIAIWQHGLFLIYRE